MSTAKQSQLVYNGLSEMKDAIEKGNKKDFDNIYKREAGRVHNCSVGDSFLQQAVESVYRKAIEKFILV